GFGSPHGGIHRRGNEEVREESGRQHLRHRQTDQLSRSGMTSPQGSNPFTFLGNLWFSYRPVLLIVVLVLFSLYTNEAIIHYRMDEYNRAMETLSQTSNSSHALNLLARFELIKQRQNMPDEDETALELRLQSLAA